METDSLIIGLGSRTNLSDGPTKWMGEKAKKKNSKEGILTNKITLFFGRFLFFLAHFW